MPALPDARLELELRTLARKVQIARGFCFVVYFVEDQRASRQIKNALGSLLASQDRLLVTLAAEVASNLVAFTLAGIFGAASEVSDVTRRPVVWAEAFRGNGDAEWDAQRRLLLMWMNERRSRFESELAAPLILLLPAGGQRDAASLAPDLWHVRLHSALLSVAGRAAGGVEAPRRRLSAVPDAPIRPKTLGTALPPEVAYWNSVHEAARGDAQALAVESLWDGFEAVQAWLRVDRTDRAIELAEQLLAIARDRVSSDVADAAWSRRELAIALKELGDALLQDGRLDDAIRTLDEGVAVASGAGRSQDGDPVQADILSRLLFGLGNALLRAGRASEAGSRFAESLELVRQLPSTGDVRESTAVTALLAHLGDAAMAREDASAAIASYRESVDLWQDLRQSAGDDPSVLRSLAAALARLGDAELAHGQGERAATVYREGLALLAGEVLLRVSNDIRGDLAVLQRRLDLAENGVARADAESGPSRDPPAAKSLGL